ncbi:hypothetical protein L596_003243 [Steinernema carpocapsae]|uniref:Myosin motor domain-containing protein n=1 Tax=Steinernema carpocapsae TaxID=34508 RepID=A0A4V6I7Y6_STECR|nr:hypothetical protein L596_003243 [Steinernema carpocapsae]
MSFSKNDLVWMDSGSGYSTPAVVVTAEPLVVYNEITNCNFAIKNPTRLTPRTEFNKMAENLCDISEETPEAVVDTLYTRFGANRYYTYNGPVLLSINPNENLSIYDHSVMKQYKTKPLENLPSHPFAVAQRAFNNVQKSTHEFILFSGESGSGKSTNAVHVMKYLAYMSSRIDTENVEDVYNVLRAFGQAKTQKNENASRTGICMDFLFGSGQGAQGFRVRQILPLDLFRLVEQKLGERNYNVFYHLCAGLSQPQKTKFGIKGANKFFYLNQGKCGFEQEVEERKFQLLTKAMDNIKFSSDQKEMCVNGDEVADIGNEAELKWVAFLLGLTAEECRNMFLKRKDSINDLFHSLNVEQALDIRDSIAQTIYEKLFSWIITQISNRFDVEGSKIISVLDFYGFERFNKNGFQEFCINAVNERMESVYINKLFKSDQSLIESEGVSSGYTLCAQFDNVSILNCLAKRPTGIIPLLSNECKFPKTSDATFIQACNVNQLDKSCYNKARSKERLEFGITHFAGTTWYHIDGFIKKNQRIISALALQNLSLSQNTSVANLFIRSEASPSDRTVYLADVFHECALEITRQLVRSNCHFIRCVRSNNHSLIGKFDHQTVARQLNALLVAETVKCVKKNFPFMMPISEFAQRYRCVLPFEATQNGKEIALVQDILDAQGIKYSNDFQIGRTLVFLRQSMSGHLQRMQSSICDRAAIVIQRNVRALVAQRSYQRKKHAVTVLQAGFRGWKTRETINRVKAKHLENLQQAIPTPTSSALFSVATLSNGDETQNQEAKSQSWALKMVGSYIPLNLSPKVPNVDLVTIEEFVKENCKNHILETRREPIFTPFLPKESDEGAGKSLHIFKLILKYTIGAGLSQKALHDLSSEIIAAGIEDQNQRDEIYIQICNQTYNCRYKSVASRAWRLMIMAVNSFPPSIHILAVLLSYFQAQQKQLRSVLMAGLLNRVRNVHIRSNRSYPPTCLEDIAFTKSLSPVVSVQFSDGTPLNVEVDSWETVGGLVKRTLNERGFCDQDGWSASIQYEDRILYAENDSFLLDAIYYLENKEQNSYEFYTIPAPGSQLEKGEPEHTPAKSLTRINNTPSRIGSSCNPSRNGTLDRQTPSRQHMPTNSNYSTMTNRIRNAKIPSRNSDVDTFFNEVFDHFLAPNDYPAISPAAIAATIKGGPQDEDSCRMDMRDPALNRTINSYQGTPTSYVPYQPFVMVPADIRMYMVPNQLGQDDGRSSRLTAVSGFGPAVMQPLVPQNMVMYMPPEGQSSPLTMHRSYQAIDPNSNFQPQINGNDGVNVKLNETFDESRQSVTMKINSRRQFATSPTNAIENSRLGQICPTSPKARFVGTTVQRDITDESIQNSLSNIRSNNFDSLVHRVPKSSIGSRIECVSRPDTGFNRMHHLEMSDDHLDAINHNDESASREYVDINEAHYPQSAGQNPFSVSQNLSNNTYNLVETPRSARKQTGLYRTPKQLYASGAEAREDMKQLGKLENGYNGTDVYKNEKWSESQNEQVSTYGTSILKSPSVCSPIEEMAKKLKSPTSFETLPPAVGLQNQPFKITIRKDIFLPNENIEAEVDADLIFEQIIGDCKTHNILKLRKHERDVVVHILSMCG